MSSIRRPLRGFTIVELLIIVTVIAILAAVVIVGYNGVQNRARTASVTNALSEAAKKLSVYHAEQNTFPANLAAVGVNDTNDVKYQYTGASTSYCVTVTNGTVSYKISDTVTTPAQGGCPGHGVGGVPPITNLVKNPTGASTTYTSGAGAAGTNSVVASGGYSGSSFVRRTFSASGSNGFYISTITGVTPGQQYVGSAYVKASKTVTITPRMEWKKPDGTSAGTTSAGSATSVGTSWMRLNVSGTAPASADRITLTLYCDSSCWASGNTQDVDAMMVTRGSTLYNYADGSTNTSWVWNGTANDASSTGPVL